MEHTTLATVLTPHRALPRDPPESTALPKRSFPWGDSASGRAGGHAVGRTRPQTLPSIKDEAFPALELQHCGKVLRRVGVRLDRGAGKTARHRHGFANA